MATDDRDLPNVLVFQDVELYETRIASPLWPSVTRAKDPATLRERPAQFALVDGDVLSGRAQLVRPVDDDLVVLRHRGGSEEIRVCLSQAPT